ncbi:hypothetical protein GW750_07290 [bacterium]|nr:hypothetical protein [bacterium]
MEADGKVNYLTATVSCIDNRVNILEEIVDTYQASMCPNYQHISLTDMRTSPYTIDIITMLNNCVMH